MHRLDQGVVKEAVKLRREGMTYREIGKILDVPFTSLIPYLRGVPRGPRREKEGEPQPDIEGDLARFRKEILEEVKDLVETKLADVEVSSIVTVGSQDIERMIGEDVGKLRAATDAKYTDALKAVGTLSQRIEALDAILMNQIQRIGKLEGTLEGALDKLEGALKAHIFIGH
jgi:hypothetical protein